MKGFLDTSVLVPVFYGDHIHHEAGEQAMLFIGSIRERLSIVALDGDEYADALEASVARGIVGGGIYDAMLARCAIKAQVEAI